MSGDELLAEMEREKVSLNAELAAYTELCQGIERWVDAGLTLRADVKRFAAKCADRLERLCEAIGQHVEESDADWWKGNDDDQESAG